MRRKRKIRFLGIPVSLLTGFEAAVLPYLAFTGDREFTWIYIPASLYLTYFLAAQYISRWWKSWHICILVHLLITWLYLPGIFTSYPPHAVAATALALVHLTIEYAARDKNCNADRIQNKVCRRKSKLNRERVRDFQNKPAESI